MPFVADNFTDTDGTLLQSHTPSDGIGIWSRHGISTSNLDIHNNRVTPIAGECEYFRTTDPAGAEYDVEIDVYVASNAGYGGVLARVNSGSFEAYAAGYNAGSGNWYLWKVSSGGGFGILGTSPATLVVGQSYHIKLECRDAAKKMFVDGVELISTANNEITAAGKAGIFNGDGTSTTGYHLDNFSASDPALSLSADVAISFPVGNLGADAELGAFEADVNVGLGASALSADASLGAFEADVAETLPVSALGVDTTLRATGGVGISFPVSQIDAAANQAVSDYQADIGVSFGVSALEAASGTDYEEHHEHEYSERMHGGVVFGQGGSEYADYLESLGPLPSPFADLNAKRRYEEEIARRIAALRRVVAAPAQVKSVDRPIVMPNPVSINNGPLFHSPGLRTIEKHVILHVQDNDDLLELLCLS